MEVLGEGEAKMTKCVHMMRGKTKNFLKTIWDFNPICEKHAIFVTQMTHEQVAKMSRQKPLYKILKILSKSFSWLGHSLASELWKLLCKLATRASTRDMVMKMSRENDQNLEILKNFF